MIVSPKYRSPNGISDAINTYMSSTRPAYLAGGTDVALKMRNGKSSFGTLVDIGSIRALTGIRTEKDLVVIGAATTITEMGESPLVKRYSAIVDSVETFGTPLIRNLGTLGGNMCNASPAADMVPPLMVLNANVEIAGPSGHRKIAVEDFFVGPGRTVLERGELVESVNLPQPSGESAFVKLGRRRASNLSVVCVAVSLGIEGGRVSKLRLSVGAAAPTPVRARSAEAAALDMPVEKAAASAAGAVGADIAPIGDQRSSAEYRKKMASVLVARAIRLAAFREIEACV